MILGYCMRLKAGTVCQIKPVRISASISVSMIQYLKWLGRAVTGDLGKTQNGHEDISKVIWQKVPATVQLGLTAWIVGLIGVPLRVMSAVKRGALWDYAGRSIILFG